MTIKSPVASNPPGSPASRTPTKSKAKKASQLYTKEDLDRLSAIEISQAAEELRVGNKMFDETPAPQAVEVIKREIIQDIEDPLLEPTASNTIATKNTLSTDVPVPVQDNVAEIVLDDEDPLVKPTAPDKDATEDTVPPDVSVPVQVIEPEIVLDDEDPLVEQTAPDNNATESTVLKDVQVLVKNKEAEKDLVDEQLVQNAFERLKDIFRKHFHEAMLAAGIYLIKEFYGGYEQAIEKKPTKAGSLRELIIRLQKSDGNTPSKTWIYDAVKLASDEHRLSDFPTYEHIGHSHKVLLTHVKNIERKKELVNETAEKKYTVVRLREIIKEGKTKRPTFISADNVPANNILEQQKINKLEDLRDEIDQGISFHQKKLDQHKTDKVRVDEVIKHKPKDNKTLGKVGFRDWTSRDFNIQQGCLNNCLYCYAKADGYRRQQVALDSWEDQIIRRHDVEKLHKLYPGLIGFPSTHDITLENLDDYLYVLGKLLRAGNEVLIVSKPRLVCIKAICAASLFFKDEILFRFTIGAMDNDVLGFWEPNAPGYEERRDCLEFAFNQGFRTSVSMEPMLDKPRIDDQIEDLRKYVKVKEHIWLGTMGHLTAMKKDADEDLLSKIVEVEAEQTMERLLPIYQKYKDDLQIKWKTKVLEEIEAHIQQKGEAAK
jgi:DNA repair photolyase